MEFKYAYYFLCNCNGEKLVIQRRNMLDTRIYENSCASTATLSPDDISADDWIVRERDRDIPDNADLSCYEFDETSLAFLKKFIERNDTMITDNDRFQYGLWADWDDFGEYHIQHMAFINTLFKISGGKEKAIFFTPDYQINFLLSRITSEKSALAEGDAILKEAISKASNNASDAASVVEWDGARYLFISTECPDSVARRILKYRIKLIADKWADFGLADRVIYLAKR